MLIKRVTPGVVEQIYDTDKKQFISQTFVPGRSDDWTSINGKSAAWPNPLPEPLPFLMKQPELNKPAEEPKSEDQIKVGDMVRSFDFAWALGDDARELTGPNANYVEGKVVGFAHMEGCERYAILVTCRIIQGSSAGVQRNEMAYPPRNGTPTTFGRIANGVEVIR